MKHLTEHERLEATNLGLAAICEAYRVAIDNNALTGKKAIVELALRLTTEDIVGDAESIKDSVTEYNDSDTYRYVEKYAKRVKNGMLAREYLRDELKAMKEGVTI